MVKTIKDFPLYSLTEKGEVLSLYEKGRRGKFGQTPRRLKTSIGTSGYETVHLYKDGKRYTLMVHRLMATTFLTGVPSRNIVNHKDLNKKNNHISNLEWVNHKENYNHASINGVMREPTVRRLLDDEMVMTIRTINNKSMDGVLGMMYGVDRSSICRVRNNKTYKW